MTIDSRIPLGWPRTSGGVGPGSAPEAAGDTRQPTWSHDGQAGAARPGPARLARMQAPALHHRELQNFHLAFPGKADPYADLPDNQLAAALKSDFAALEKLNKAAGRLTMSAVHQIAGERLGESERQDHTIQLAKALVKRPRLRDAVLDRDGCMTRERLEQASHTLMGNSDPAAFSPDPFHASSNAGVVQALRSRFDDLRDPSQDRAVLFEKYRYVAVDRLRSMSLDPDETDSRGESVLDHATGLPRKRYDEEHVYMAKNLVERRDLLPGLISASAHGSGLFLSHKDGYLSNKGLDRWLEQDKAQKAR